jgi:hypothetical protein
MPHNVGKTDRKMADERLKHLKRFYALLDRVEYNIGGARTLAGCSGRMDWPRRGVYLFREPGEMRSDTGTGPRIVRVGTHAVTETSRTKLWGRLSQHKGPQGSGGGHHRGSVFRDIVGAALIKRDGRHFPTWGEGNSAPRDIRAGEHEMECLVSQGIGKMPFLWLAVDNEVGPETRRYIERNFIALLSNYGKPALDPSSPDWLGLRCQSDRLRDGGLSIRESGLWNSNHVDESYDPAFLGELERLVATPGGAS